MTGSTKSDFIADFSDPGFGTVTPSTTLFPETLANNGTIATTSILTLTGDSFVGVPRTLLADTDYVAS